MINTNETFESIRKHLPDVAQYIKDKLYLATSCDSIGDTLNTMADEACPCYMGELLNWAKNESAAGAYIDNAIQSGAGTMQGALSEAFCEWARDGLYNARGEVLRAWAYAYIAETLGISELTDEQAERVDGIDYDGDRWDVLADEIREAIAPEADE